MLKNYSKVKVDESGTKRYYNDEGNYHRLDGPATEDSSGTKFWYINDKEHRNIDPSNEWSAERKYWCFNNKRHRIGGSFNSYSELWRIHGKVYTKEDYFNKVWDI